MLDDLFVSLWEIADDRFGDLFHSKLATGALGMGVGSIPIFSKKVNDNKMYRILNEKYPDCYNALYLTKHVWISGTQGSGKSNKLRRIFINSFIKQGYGGIYIDTHGTADLILGSIPPKRWKDVIYIAPWMGRVWGINVLQRYDMNDPGEVDKIAEDVVDVFAKMYPRAWGEKIANCIRFATKAVLIYQEKNLNFKPTLMDIYRMLKDDAYAQMIKEDVDSEIITGFFEALKAHQATGKLENPLSSENVIAMLCQTEGFNMLDAMNQKKIIICNLDNDKLSTNANLIAGMLVSVVAKCAANRKEDDEVKSPYFAVAMDEFYEYANKHVSTLISQMRKKNVCVLLANQYREQLPSKDLQSAVSMCQFKFAHSPADVDLSYVESTYREWITKEEIKKMPYFHCIHDEHIPGKSREPFITPTPKFVPDYNWEYCKKLKYASLSRAPERWRIIKDLKRSADEIIIGKDEVSNTGDIIDVEDYEIL